MLSKDKITVFVILNYCESMRVDEVKVFSQSYVMKRYIKLLEGTGEYNVVVLYRSGGDSLNKIIDAKNYVCLNIPNNLSDGILHYAYIDYLKKQKVNDKLIYSFQPNTMIDLFTELHNPSWMQFPKIIHHFIGDIDDALPIYQRYKQMCGIVISKSMTVSEYSKNCIKKQASKFFCPAVYRKVELDAIDIGVDVKGFEEAAEKYKKLSDTFMFRYAGNFITSKKHIDKMIDVFDVLYRMGKNFKVEFALVDECIKKAPNREYLTVVRSYTGEQYKQKVAETHAFICCSDSESYGIAYWEFLAAGVVGLYIDKPWVRDIGKMADFFLARNVEDLTAKALYVMDHYDEVLAKQKEWWNDNRARFARENTDKRFVEVFKKYACELLERKEK